MGLALLAIGGADASAQLLTVPSSPGTITVSVATAGAQPSAVTDATTSYTANALTALLGQKITGQLSANMPAGVTLKVYLAPTTGATSAGTVTLDNTARDLVTGITNVLPQTRGITYTLTATVAAGVISTSVRVVTLTLVSFP